MSGMMIVRETIHIARHTRYTLHPPNILSWLSWLSDPPHSLAVLCYASDNSSLSTCKDCVLLHNKLSWLWCWSQHRQLGVNDKHPKLNQQRQFNQPRQYWVDRSWKQEFTTSSPTNLSYQRKLTWSRKSNKKDLWNKDTPRTGKERLSDSIKKDSMTIYPFKGNNWKIKGNKRR